MAMKEKTAHFISQFLLLLVLIETLIGFSGAIESSRHILYALAIFVYSTFSLITYSIVEGFFKKNKSKNEEKEVLEHMKSVIMKKVV